FFEDLKVHLHTSANTNVSSPNIYLMGGWPQTASSRPNRGWRMGVTNDYFNTKDFDPANRAFPYEVANPVTDYEKSSGEFYHVRAQPRWLGVVNFDYPLDWSSSTRSFQSHAPIEDSLLVLTASHQVKYLSARHAELAFGIQYKGVPQINLANIA